MSDSEINRFLQFQGLIFFYLESFSLSKFFSKFRTKIKTVRVWHGFCRDEFSDNLILNANLCFDANITSYFDTNAFPSFMSMPFAVLSALIPPAV